MEGDSFEDRRNTGSHGYGLSGNSLFPRGGIGVVRDSVLRGQMGRPRRSRGFHSYRNLNAEYYFRALVAKSTQ
jgi:hypothetical protein